ncbi:MAG: glycosyltransferase, partial [Phycisphaerales bacterium]
MNVAMIMSKDRLNQENAMLNRLVVGLMDSGNNVIRIVPTFDSEELPFYENAVSLATRITIPIPVSRLLRAERKSCLTEQCKKYEVDALVSFGKDALEAAIDVGTSLDIPVLCEVLSMSEASRVRKGKPIWRWLAPTPSMEETITRRVGEDRVALVPMGVSKQLIEKETSEAGQHSQCAVVLDAGGNLKQTASVLKALQKYPNVHIFLELFEKSNRRVWKMIHQLVMHDRVTCLLDISSLRSLVPHADVLILPNAKMPLRTVLLEAMAQEVPVVCTAVPGFDMLVDEETAFLSNDSWENSLTLALDDTTIAHR